MKIRFPILLVLFVLTTQIIFSQNESLQKVTFLGSDKVSAKYVGYYMAKEKDIYNKYGLDVTILDRELDKEVSDCLTQGTIDFGSTHLSTAIVARDNNIKLVNIGQIFQESSILFVAKKKSGIKTIDDFTGKKVAIWRSSLEELTSSFLEDHQLDVEIIKINEGINIFLKNSVDICIATHYNEYNSLYNFGIEPEELDLFYFKDYEMNFPEDGIYCMEDTYKSDSSLCRKFFQATIEGLEYALNNEEEALKVISNYQDVANIRDNKTHSRWTLNCMKQLIQPTDENAIIGSLSEKSYDKTVQYLFKNKKIKNVTEFHVFHREGFENE